MKLLNCFYFSVLLMYAVPGLGQNAQRQDGNLHVAAEFEVPHYDFTNDFIILPVQIRGKTYNFTVDTGSGYTAIDVHIRDLAGPEIPRSSVSAVAAGTRLRFCRSPEGMRLGSLEMANLAVVALVDLRALNRFHAVRIDGIIGMDFLSDYILEWDPGTRTLRFLIGTEAAAQHHGTATKMAFDDFGRPMVSGKMGGKFTAQMLVDTGMAHSVSVLPEVFKGLRDTGAVSRVYVENFSSIDGAEDGKLGRLSKLSIGSIEARNLKVRSWKATLLGWGFLKHYHATFDFPNATLYLRERKDRELTDGWDLSGLKIYLDGSKVRIHWVVPNSPAENAGCRDWDLITSIDGRPAGKYAFYEIGELLSKEGETRHLGLLRDGRPLEVVVPLKEYRMFEDEPSVPLP